MAMIDCLCEHWQDPDEGIWETRGGRRPFCDGQLMSWVALDRAIRMATSRGRGWQAGGAGYRVTRRLAAPRDRPARRDGGQSAGQAPRSTRGRPSASRTDRSGAAPARQGAARSAGPGRLVGGARQPRSRRLCGGRRHDNAHVGPRLSPALPGRRPLKAMARRCGSPGDRRRGTRPPRRNQRPCLHRGHVGGCQPAAQAARPPAPAPPGHKTTCRSPAT